MVVSTLMLLCPLLGCGGSKTFLTIEPKPSLVDDSVASSRIHDREHRRVMIVPPSGTAGATFDQGLAAAERVLMRQGCDLISPAVTGRVINPDSAGEVSDAGVALSDMERALVLAERSNADVVLQIGDLSFEQPSLAVDSRPSGGGLGGRYFVFDDSSGMVVERESDAYDAANPRQRWRFVAPVVVLTGKIIDVTDGALLASLQFKSDIALRLPKSYVAEVRVPARSPRNESWDWLDPTWANRSCVQAIGDMFRVVGAMITGAETP
jgi:hypothetical protein